MKGDGVYKRPLSPYWYFKLKLQGRWKEFSTKTGNYHEARRRRKKAHDELEAGRFIDREKVRWPFERAAEEFLEVRKRLVSPGTWVTDRDRLKSLKRFFAGKRLGDITAQDISDYKDLRKREGMSNRTVNMERSVLRGLLMRARLWSRLADDPQVKALRISKGGPGRALSPEEKERLLSTAESRPSWLVAYCGTLAAVHTTMRGGELKSLYWHDVELFNRTVTVRRIGTKTDAGARIIPLNRDALSALVTLRKRVEALGAVNPDHYVFPACENGHIDPTRPQKTWRTAWRNLTKAAGLKGLRFHDMRHHAITELAERDASDQTIMALSGHVSHQMLEHYSHIRMEAKRRAVEALERERTPSHVGELPVKKANLPQ